MVLLLQGHHMHKTTLELKYYGIDLDYHDSERVMKTTNSKYFVTPKRWSKVEAWMIMEDKEKLSKEDVIHLIDNDYIGSYK